MLAPICLFTYNRLYETQLTLEALKRNYLAAESNLFIFSDGPKNEEGKSKVDDVRNYINSVDGFKSVKVSNSEENNGLASSIIHGVTQILEQYDKVIVLEDDLITSKNFLTFINKALVHYQDNEKIQSLCGYSLSLKDKSQFVNFQTRTFSWGWATWKDRWNPDIFNKEKIKTEINSNPSVLKNFERKCGSDMPKMLMDSINNKNDSWYVRWAFDHFRKNHYAAFPAYSFVQNIGHNENATHCKGINTYISDPVNQDVTSFELPAFHPPHERASKEFLSYFSFKHKVIIRLKLLKTQNGREMLFRELKMRITSKNR